jgi:hypothetical protein
MKCKYTKEIKDLWMPEAQATFDDLWQSVLLDPCLHQFDPTKLMVLRTNFPAKGFRYIVCQPGNNEASLELVSQFMSGKGFQCLTKTDNSVLYPVTFGSCQLCGNECYLHWYLGEAFCGDFAMNKFHHMCYGGHVVWDMDGYAVIFILSYNGANQAILELQMRLIKWDVDIVHCCNDHLVDADYWSRLNCNLCYDLSFYSYLRHVESFCQTHPAPTKIPIDAEHMPYYQGPCVHSLLSLQEELAEQDVIPDAPAPIDDAATALFTKIVTSRELGLTSLSIQPLEFSMFTTPSLAVLVPLAWALYDY